MLKLNASYAKKIPAETNYSSQSYHCQIECELPDGLTSDQLQERIHATFAVVRQAVEAELHDTQATQSNTPRQSGHLLRPVPPSIPQSVSENNQQSASSAQTPSAPPPYQENNLHPAALASSKQINYLLSLAKQTGWSVQNIINHFQVNRLEEISKRQCSQLINQLSGRAA